uniref:Uncharacterized protein n=1 Tax=Avena sativa TaxID=4498 RepID=A0ACD5U031_AVESA
MAGNSTQDCLGDELALLSKRVRGFVFRIVTLIVANTMLMGLIAWISTYAHRYRHHPLIRFLYLGATTLFLPVVSYVVSTLENPYTFTIYEEGDRVITAKCDAFSHIGMAMLWIGLVQIIGTNATAIVASDSREGRSIVPPSVQLVQALWTSYLAYITIEARLPPSDKHRMVFHVLIYLLHFLPYALILAKLLFKYYAWYEARRSLALGRNPRLIVGYMEQLQCGDNHSELRSQYVPPPLIVMGESTILVKKHSHGYNLIGVNNNGLVTIDKIWQFDDIVLLRPTKKYKDLCFSFALFKLLRCRFAKYTISEAGFMKARNFIRDLLLNESDDERVLGVIAHELSFLQDYYYTSLPISYSKSWLPILTVSISLSSIAYCLVFMFIFLMETWGYGILDRSQIYCYNVNCHTESGPIYMHQSEAGLAFGRLYFDIVPLFLLATLVMLVEVREIASYVCSNWTKVGLICGYVNHSSWQQSAMIRKCAGLVLHTRCKLMDHWEDKMNQCSILVLHGRKNPLALFRRLAHLPDQKKVPRAVKAAVVGVVRSYQRIRCPRNGATPLQLKVSDNSDPVWTFHGAKGPADAMLVCHVATSILEVRSRCHKQPLSDHETVATHLSRYCAYLVAYAPELLPDDALWCSSLYKAVKKDAARALSCGGMTASMAPEAEDQRLVRLLSTSSEHHQVLKDGAELGRRLAELPEGDEVVAWKVLAGFWSETIICVAAACDNIDTHAEAVARGGELVTLLWALLAHIGGVDEDAAAATHGAPADV